MSAGSFSFLPATNPGGDRRYRHSLPAQLSPTQIRNQSANRRAPLGRNRFRIAVIICSNWMVDRVMAKILYALFAS
jgi:hypothetical protein